jgi:F-type H+-transporting ATPase subunit a
MSATTTFGAALLGPLAADDPLSHILPHRVFSFGDFGVTNHMVMLLASALLLMFVLPIAARTSDVVPKGFRNFLESILQFLREEVARPVLGHHTDHFIPFLWTLFFLILTANLLGMVPVGVFAGTLDAHLQHIGGTATGNFSVTAALAICAFVFVHASGMKEQGAGTYLKNLAPHVPWPLLILLYPLEILGAVVKAFALAIRLFANMIAGHIVIAVILGFSVAALRAGGGHYAVTGITVIGSVAMSLMEVFVAFLQAYIFTYLTTLFVGMAIHPEH